MVKQQTTAIVISMLNKLFYIQYCENISQFRKCNNSY